MELEDYTKKRNPDIQLDKKRVEAIKRRRAAAIRAAKEAELRKPDKTLIRKHKRARRSIFLSKHRLLFLVMCILELILIIYLCFIVFTNYLKQRVYLNFVNSTSYPKVMLVDINDDDFEISEGDIPGMSWKIHNKIMDKAQFQYQVGDYEKVKENRKVLYKTDVILDDMAGSKYYEVTVRMK